MLRLDHAYDDATHEQQVIRWGDGELKLAYCDSFGVGVVGDTDLELLSLTNGLHRYLGLTRTYFSAFHPVIQTPLKNVTSTDSMREFRLYQSSFLLRDYGWEVEDLPFSEGGNLPTSLDPKKAYAEAHLCDAPSMS